VRSLGVLGAALVCSCGTEVRLEDVVGNMAKADRLIAAMRTDLYRSVEAEKNAVLAITDEESRTCAQQAVDAAAAVDLARVELAHLIEAGGRTQEVKLLGEFDQYWGEFRKVDQELLALAVQNTNLKAGALSFGQGREAVGRLEESLSSLIERQPVTPKGLRAAQLAAAALAAGLGIHALEAPHIIEAGDGAMDSLEAAMNRRADRAKAAFGELASLVRADDRVLLGQAQEAFTDLLKVNAQVLRLSRQNTNVKSMALSLGAKRKVTALCGEALDALQMEVSQRRFRATR
jgi:hypothetical protein